ncbi:MAG TPA: thioredoxin domain-containing protein, partial [Methylomirabilota bacterium]|nr:thioredoxin domain-containing protein [Methylomirabilota bacterium]
RKPFQDSPTPAGNSVAAIALIRMHAATDEPRYRQLAQKTLEAFAAVAPQYGLFAATYGLAAVLFERHPLQVVVTGPAGDPAASALEDAANSVYRFGKTVLRVTPGVSFENFPSALREALPHLPADRPIALVCAGQSCLPPTSKPEELRALLESSAAGATSA